MQPPMRLSMPSKIDSTTGASCAVCEIRLQSSYDRGPRYGAILLQKSGTAMRLMSGFLSFIVIAVSPSLSVVLYDAFSSIGRSLGMRLRTLGGAGCGQTRTAQ